jgi:hypothetical protein
MVPALTPTGFARMVYGPPDQNGSIKPLLKDLAIEARICTIHTTDAFGDRRFF